MQLEVNILLSLFLEDISNHYDQFSWLDPCLQSCEHLANSEPPNAQADVSHFLSTSVKRTYISPKNNISLANSSLPLSFSQDIWKDNSPSQSSSRLTAILINGNRTWLKTTERCPISVLMVISLRHGLVAGRFPARIYQMVVCHRRWHASMQLWWWGMQGGWDKYISWFHTLSYYSRVHAHSDSCYLVLFSWVLANTFI